MADIIIDNNIYDECRTYPNCTVEILRNSVTGKESVGWWRNDKPPIGKKKRKVRIVTMRSERDEPKVPVNVMNVSGTKDGKVHTGEGYVIRLIGFCPVCGSKWFNTFDYCPKCGQKLDWEHAEVNGI